MNKLEERRNKILHLLKQQDMRCIDIAEILCIRDKTITYDLSYLKAEGLAFDMRQGKHTVWTLDAAKAKKPQADPAEENKRLRQKHHNMELTYACIKRGNNTAMGVFTELKGKPGIKTIGSINIYIKALIKQSRVKRGPSLRISSNIERTTYQVTQYQYDGQFKDALGAKAMLMMGINPYPHKPGPPVEVKSHSMGGITHKPPQSYGVADYGAFA